jgi:hypothetical protein
MRIWRCATVTQRDGAHVARAARHRSGTMSNAVNNMEIMRESRLERKNVHTLVVRHAHHTYSDGVDF